MILFFPVALRLQEVERLTLVWSYSCLPTQAGREIKTTFLSEGRETRQHFSFIKRGDLKDWYNIYGQVT